MYENTSTFTNNMGKKGGSSFDIISNSYNTLTINGGPPCVGRDIMGKDYILSPQG